MDDAQYHEFEQKCNDFMVGVVQPFLDQHEAEVHDGEFCADERGNLLAWMAHRIGHDDQVWKVMLDRLEWYRAHHEEHGH